MGCFGQPQPLREVHGVWLVAQHFDGERGKAPPRPNRAPGAGQPIWLGSTLLFIYLPSKFLGQGPGMRRPALVGQKYSRNAPDLSSTSARPQASGGHAGAPRVPWLPRAGLCSPAGTRGARPTCRGAAGCQLLAAPRVPLGCWDMGGRGGGTCEVPKAGQWGGTGGCRVGAVGFAVPRCDSSFQHPPPRHGSNAKGVSGTCPRSVPQERRVGKVWGCCAGPEGTWPQTGPCVCVPRVGTPGIPAVPVPCARRPHHASPRGLGQFLWCCRCAPLPAAGPFPARTVWGGPGLTRPRCQSRASGETSVLGGSFAVDVAIWGP